MTDTPETESWCGWGVGGLEVVPASFARKLERERDNALSDWRQADTDSIRALHERNEAREQRDRLAAILKGIRNGYGGQVASPDCCEDCDFLITIDEALQSLTNQPK
jgi:hypothetical protein